MPTLPSGVTRDTTGSPLGGVTVKAFDATTDALVATGVSDAQGNYAALSVPGAGPYYVMAYKASGTFVAGTTRRDLASIADPVVATVQSLWTGVPTNDGAVISAKLLNAATSTRVAVSTSETLSNPTYTDAVAPDATYRFAKHRVTGKAANTEYWYAVEVDGVIDLATKGHFKTLPPAGAANFSIVMGGCSENTNDAAFAAISAMNPAPLFFLHMGDFQYMDVANPSTASYNNAFDVSLARSVRGKTHREIPTVYMWDDHDYQGANGNGTGRTATNTDNAWRAIAAAFYRSRVPMIPASNTAGDAVYSSFVVGRMRFLICDLRSNKTLQSAVDDATKTMMGADQKQWWKDQIAAAKDANQAVAWLSGVPWHSAADTDTWFGYSTERTELANHIRDMGMGGKVFVLASDMHGLAYKDTIDYATGGGGATPVLQAGPLNRLSSNKGGPYTYGPFPSIFPQVNAVQYAIMDVTDDGVTLTVTWRGINAADGATKFTYSFTPLVTGTPAPATVPAKMAKPTAVAGNGQATVTLVAPYNGGDPIIRYALGMPAGAVDQQAGTTALVRTVTGLANGVPAQFTARAENNVGAGLYSDASDAVTPVAPAAGGFNATGGTVTEPGDGYRYWTFNASDTLNVTDAGNVEYLVVAGGGAGSSGGSSAGGGGGAGGVKQGTIALAAQAYAITVGAGGVGSTGLGTNGGNSSIAALIEALGGGHGGHSATAAAVGGSGGGGNSTTGMTAAAAGTAGQGNAGGVGFESTTQAQRSGGGGGGAGGPGAAAVASDGGDGGLGITVWGKQYAGGGGGASQTGAGDGVGTFGGGTARNAAGDPLTQNGTANTGGGGAGGAVSMAAGNGGTGVVVLRRAL